MPLQMGHAASEGAGPQLPPNFLAPYLSPYSSTYTYGMVTRVGRACFQGSDIPLKFRSVVPQHRQNFGTSYMHAHRMRNSDQILPGDQSRCEKKFSGSTMPAAWTKFLVTLMLVHN